MNDLQVKSYFDNSSEVYQGNKDHLSNGSWEKVDELLADLVSDDARILDVGCGEGYLIEYCLHRGLIESGVGLELSAEMLPDNTSEPHEVVQGSALDLPFNSNAEFDVVILSNLLHHLVGSSRQDSKLKAISCLESVLELTKDDGHLLITEQCHEGPLPESSLTSKLIFTGLYYLSPIAKLVDDDVQDGLLVSFYTRRELRDLIERAGGEIVEERQRPLSTKTFTRRLLTHNHSRVHLIVS